MNAISTNRWRASGAAVLCAAMGALWTGQGLPPATTPATSPGVPPATAPSAEPARLRFPTWGISFVPPDSAAGWVQDLDAKPSMAVRFVKLDPKTDQSVAEIIIACGPTPPGKTPREVLKTSPFPKDILPQDFAIDGMPAAALRKDKGATSTPALLVFATVRGNDCYMLTARGPENSPNAELVALCKSIKWIDREPFADHLNLEAQPRKLLETKLVARLPATFHRDQLKTRVSGTDKVDAFDIYSVDDGKPLVSLYFTRYPGMNNRSPDVVKQLQLLIDQLEKNGPEVRKIEGKEGAVSSYLAVDSKEKNKSYRRVGLLALGKDTVMIQIFTSEEDPKRLDKWSAMFDQILQTVEDADAAAPKAR